MKITAIYDNGGKTLDRYTVVTDTIEGQDSTHDPTEYLALCLNTGGRGYSEWAAVVPGRHLGKRIQFETLDTDTQTHIARRVFVDE